MNGEQLVFVMVGAVIHRAMLEHGPLTKRWLASLVDLVLFGVVPRQPSDPSPPDIDPLVRGAIEPRAGDRVVDLGGILVPKARRPDACRWVAEVEKLYPQAREKKGSDLVKVSKGRAALEGFLRSLLASDCTPVFAVVEKRFSVACRIVECLFDVRMNAAAGGLRPDDNINRKRLGVILAGLPDYYLELFVRAYRDPSEAAFRTSIQSLVRALKERHQHFLAKLLKQALADLPRLVEEETDDEAIWGGRRNRAISINVTSFFAFLQQGRRQLRELGDPATEVVHDQIHSLEAALQVAWTWGKSEQPTRTLRDGTTIEYGLAPMQALRMGNSKLEPEVPRPRNASLVEPTT